MRINISARHLELTKGLSDYVQKKVEKCKKYFDHVVWAQIILSVEKKYRHNAEIIIHAGKTSFRGKAESIDMYAAVDLALDKIEKQLHKRKEIMKDSRKSRAASISPEKMAEEIEKMDTKSHLINETKRYYVKPMSIRAAIEEMEAMKDAFYMFMNENTSQVNVVYKTSSNSYGIIEPKE